MVILLALIHQLRDECNIDVLAAGLVIKPDETTMASRPVLRLLSDETLVVHTQYFPNWPASDEAFFENGNYLGHDLTRAMQLFTERCQRQVENCAHLGELNASA